MNRKEYIKHYVNVLNCPNLGIHPEKEDYLKNEIKQLADIDNISYPLALSTIRNDFLMQYLETDFDDNDFKKIETASMNLSFLKRLEGKEHKDD